MPFRDFAMFCFVKPLVGIMQMETGGDGGSVLQSGNPINAAIAFLVGMLAFAVALLLSRELRLFQFNWSTALPAPTPHDPVWKLATASLIAMVLFTLFVSGGINLALQTIGRGDLQSGFGNSGAISYVIVKCYLTATTIYLSLLYARRLWHHAANPLVVPPMVVAVIALSFGLSGKIAISTCAGVLPAALYRFMES